MENIDYSEIKPIDECIEPFKRTSKVHYGFHGYFTTQPYNVVSKYIEHFTSPGDLVLDPFVGSGVTAVESLRIKRRSMAVDINPFAVFLTKAKCSYVSIEKLEKYYHKVISKTESHCLEIESLSSEKAELLDIPFWYPNDVKLPSNADVKYLHEIFTRKQLYQLAFIKDEIDSFPESNEKDILLILFCGTLSRANIAYSLPDDGRSIFSGDFTIFQTGRYRIPKKIVEIPVMEVFKRRYLLLKEAKKETNTIFKEFVNPKTFNAVVSSATNLKQLLKDNSVDYIYTDPPYGGHIAYLDLSTVYNSWLNLEVTPDMFENEIIEGGEIKHTMNDYKSLLKESFSEMARVLKPNKWLSLVFHHKEPSLWTNIVETAKSVGLEYKNSVVQHTKLPSWHKIDVPQTVLSSQMIVNFIRKENAYFSVNNTTLSLNQLILNVAEREIVKRHGANLEEIINSLVPELFEHNYIYDQAQTTSDKIFKFLLEEFDFNSDSKTFNLKEHNLKKIGSYIPFQDRVKYYLISYLKSKRRVTLDELIPAILPKLINGQTPSGEQIMDELRKIAQFDGKYWVFVSEGFQTSFNFEAPTHKTEYSKGEVKLPDNLSDHDLMIYKLSLLANKYKLVPKVGKKEQDEPFLKAMSQVEEIKSNKLSHKKLNNINNIDCLWFTSKSSYPIFAFEVEHSTEITSAFERFLSLLKFDSDIGNQKRLILVISHKNKNKFNTVIRESSYIGAPHYINNKIKFIFEETLIERFEELMNEKDFTKFEGLMTEPNLG